MRTSHSWTALAGLLLLAACQRPATAGAASETPAANATAPTTAPAGNVAAAAPIGSDDPGSEDPGSQFDIKDMIGRWRVAGVAVGDGVAARVKDDPDYVGQMLTIAADRLAWDKPPAGSGATLDDRCQGPATQHMIGQARRHLAEEYRVQLAALGPLKGDPHSVECLEDGNWGPEAAGGASLWRAQDGALLMNWYDGIVLKLVRAG